MWSFDKLNAVHLELSSRCNAACPGCPRYLRNSPIVDSNLQQTDISIETFKKWFSPATLSKIKNWIICGTHGDPITCKDLVEILQYITQHSSGQIQINTANRLKCPHSQYKGTYYLRCHPDIVQNRQCGICSRHTQTAAGCNSARRQFVGVIVAFHLGQSDGCHGRGRGWA